MTRKAVPTKIDGDTPTLRLLGLLEVIAECDRLVTLPELVAETGLPKPTVHRMLQQLEAAGMLQRDADRRHYSSGLRLRQLAENILLNGTIHGGRHAILSRIVEEIGESCNITALSGNQVLYIDRVETTEPLRFFLHPGSRVPIHCSASGKLLLSQMNPTQQQRLLAHSALEGFTNKTLTSTRELNSELEQIRRNGYAIDNEEFLSDLLCIAVQVPRAGGQSNMCIAVQAPTTRLNPKTAIALLPRLRRAARAIAAVDTNAPNPASDHAGDIAR